MIVTKIRANAAQPGTMAMSQESWRRVFDAFEDPMFLHDRRSCLLMANRAYCRAAGMTETAALGKPYWEVFPRGAAAMPGCDDAACTRDHDGCQEEVRVGAKLFLSKSYPVRDDDPREPLYFLHILTDITAQRQAETDLMASEEAVRHGIERAHDAIITVSGDSGLVTAWNPAAEAVFGYSQEEVIGRVHLGFLALPQFRDAALNGMTHFAIAGGTEMLGKSIELAAVHKDGRKFPIEISFSAKKSQGVWFTTGIARDITERNKAHASEERYRRLFESAKDGILILDAETGMLVDVNPFITDLLGYSREDCLGKHVWDLGFLRNVAANKEKFLELQQQGYVRYDDLPLETVQGKMVRVEFVSNVYLVGAARVIQCNIRDITMRKQAEAELRIAAAAFESQEGMMITDANSVILRVNRAFTETTGYTAEEVVGQTPHLLHSGRHNADFYREMRDTLQRTGGWQGEVWDRAKNGAVYPKWLAISAVKDDGGAVTHYIGTHYDITERKRAEEKIHELAFFDQPTGLPNRTLLLDRLKQAIAVSSRSGGYGALLFIDLDNFKTLNDTLGHDMGDQLLKQVAQRLTLCMREGDTVARLGGDEFVVVLAGLSPGEGEAAADIEAVAEKIRAALSRSYQLSHVLHHSTASIGITLFRGDLATIDELMKQADLAMYQAKAAGRNDMRFFDPDMQAVVTARANLEAELREALREGQFLLYYQAQVVGGNRLTGAEVLVRWQHPQRGLVSPAEFIPLAEESGLILPLGHWVLQTACSQLAVWATRPEMAHFTVAVNISAHQFRQDDFVDQVLAVLENTGANPQRLKLELTESLLLSNVEGVIEKMFALKAKGVGFSLDDFGTGYSSLTYLKRLPLDQLKIDQSFVRDILVDPNDAAIAKTIIALAQSLGLGVIAEGVETATQLDFLASSGCYAYQGYFFSRPLPLDGFEDFAASLAHA